MRYPKRALAVAVLLCALGAGACAAQETAELVVSSDPELASLAGALLPDLARRSGMELRHPVRVELRSRDDLVRYLRAKLDEELPPEEAEAIVASYALLGLVPADLDLRAVLLDLYTEQVAGFYEPDSTALFVLDDQSEADLHGLLLHELVHAVQDQTVDLDALTDPDVDSDRATAAQAAIEGHATLVMFEYMIEEQTGTPMDLSAVPEFGPALRQSLEGAREQFTALAGAPRIVQEALIFPYVEGAVFLQRLWATGERVVPFGAELPLSTEEILDGAGAPAPVEVTLAVEGGDIVHDDVLGRLELGVLLEELAGPAAAAAAVGWAGDRYALVRRPDGERALVAHLVWEDEGARDAFHAAIAGEEGRFGGPVAIERVDAGGWPTTRLTVGDPGDVVVRVASAERR